MNEKPLAVAINATAVAAQGALGYAMIQSDNSLVKVVGYLLAFGAVLCGLNTVAYALSDSSPPPYAF